MDYTNLLNSCSGKTSRVGLIGANQGFGYTLLAQMSKVKQLELRVVCDLDPEKSIEVLKETGFGGRELLVCETREAVSAAPADAVLVVRDYRLVPDCGITALVESTGNTALGCEVALTALRRGINVYMVSKETDSFCGPLLNRVAAENKAVYALVNGDQPRNLIDLYSWAKLLGLEIIAAGKSSEYDLVWDRETGRLSYLDGSGAGKDLPELLDCWRYQDRRTLEKRQELLREYTGAISADLCEMNLVSNVIGFVPACPTLSYPIARVSELADIFIPEEDGGILKRTGVVDVFFNLREKDEASFCGGEFIIVKCENKKMWDILAGKGHVISRSGKYACIYSPYHFMGMETPATILLGDLMGIGSHPECRQVSIMAGIAQQDLPKGTVLKVAGHHHAIQGLTPQLLERTAADKAAPFYLLNGAVLLREVKKGCPVTTEDVDLSGLAIYQHYQKGVALG